MHQTTGSLDISRLANYLVDCSLAADDDAVEQTLTEIGCAVIERLGRRGATHRLSGLACQISHYVPAERTGFEPADMEAS